MRVLNYAHPLTPTQIARLEALTGRRPKPMTKRATDRQLCQLLVTREALQTVRQQLVNQRHALLHWPVVVDSPRDHLTALIDELDTRIGQLEAGLRRS